QQSYTTTSHWVEEGAGGLTQLDTNTADLLSQVEHEQHLALQMLAQFEALTTSLEDPAGAYDSVYRTLNVLLTQGLPSLIDLLRDGQLSQFDEQLSVVAVGAEQEFNQAFERYTAQQQSIVDQRYQQEADQYALVWRLVGFAIAFCVFICIA